MQQGSVISPDGTRIGWIEQGRGRPLVLIHGLGGTHERWLGIMPKLAEHARVVALDRRGRGLSGDTEPYSFEREFEDAAVVADAVGGGAVVLGHSGGGPLALEAGLRSPGVRHVVLYEAWPSEIDLFPPGIVAKLEALLRDGRREAVLETFIREVVGFDDAMVERWKASPAWPSRVAAAHVTPREIRGWEELDFDPARYASDRFRISLMIGENDLEPLMPSIKRWEDAVPGVGRIVLQGQGHVAMDTGPDVFVEAVAHVLAEKASDPL